jgi:putative transcriptional regulator
MKLSNNFSFGIEDVKVGSLLLSEPFMHDCDFTRTVILIIEHDESIGTCGLILNKPTSIEIKEMFLNFPESDHRIFVGGPVSQGTLHVITQGLGELSDSIHLGHGFYYGGAYDELSELVTERIAIPTNSRFFLGYTGWHYHQLKKELEDKTWMVANPDKSDILLASPTTMWQDVVLTLDDSFSIYANAPLDPSLN